MTEMHSESGDWDQNAPPVGFKMDVLIGALAKEAIKRLLSESGYVVNDFDPLINSLQQIIRSPLGKSETTQKVFSKPDLLVRDPERQDLESVEVKYRNRPASSFGFSAADMLKYLAYWRESIVVAVTPSERVFYAQVVGNLEDKIETNDDPEFLDVNLRESFIPLEVMFPKCNKPLTESYRTVIRRMPQLREDGPHSNN